jgi:thiopurine S-methyltransferase
MNKFDKAFWEELYKTNDTGWNIGYISTPIKEYIDQLHSKELKILIPGAGNSYEAEYLWKKGFKNLFVLDIAEQPLLNLKNRIPDFPDNQLLLQDFFQVNDKFDLIIEQTFFCALNPSMREDYVTKMSKIINQKGKLIGLLFDFPLDTKGPPFGGSKDEYLKRFAPYFKINTLERSYNSIKPREDKELFFIFEKNYHN